MPLIYELDFPPHDCDKTSNEVFVVCIIVKYVSMNVSSLFCLYICTNPSFCNSVKIFVHWSLVIICVKIMIFFCKYYLHYCHENRHTKHKWFCG